MYRFTESLKDKVAIITGGTRGIGIGIAKLFVSEGAQVIITGRGETNSAADEINNEFINETKAGKAKYISCNISNKDQITNLINAVISEFGKIDSLVNNAGITKDTLLMKMKDEEWNNVINTNLTSLFHICKAVLKPMAKQRSGSIINMSSVVGLHGNPAQCNYSASKAGMIGFTKSFAKEYGRRGIRANCIAPGFITTDMTDELPSEVRKHYQDNIPLGDFGKVQDIAETALFLANSANYITGQVIQVDGGLFM